AGDLGLGAPLGLERQIDVLPARLGLRAPDPCLELLGELALLPHRVEDRRPAFLQLPQIAQPLLDRAQLRIVEHLGRFLAVASDEGHRRAAVEQLHGGLDLPLPYAELLGDPAFDGPCCWGPGCRHDPVPPSSTEVARQLWQVTATIGDQGADAPGAVGAAVTPGGCACWRRPRRRAGPVPGREGSRRWRWRRRSGGERLRWHGTRAFLSSA